MPVDYVRAWVGSRWLWSLAFAGYFLVIGAWAVALPPNAGPDESAHVIRAAGVASGQIRPGISGPGVFDARHQVPGGYEMSTCYVPDVGNSAECVPAFDGRKRWIVTPAGRYFPGYYMLVGGPLVVWPGYGGLVVARLISAALAAAFLACAFVGLARWSRNGFLLGGLVVAVTPMVAHMAATINPNGVEIAAGVALFASLIVLVFGDRNRPKTPLVLLYAVSAIYIVTAKANGPIWVGVATLPFLLPWRGSNLAYLLKGWLARLCVAAIVVATAIAVVWIVLLDALVLVPVTGRLGQDQALISMVQRWPRFTNDIIGLVGWGETGLPALAYPIWMMAAGGVLMFAFVVGGRVERWRLGALIALVVGVPFAMQFQQAPEHGLLTQARYLLPLLVGVPLLAAWTIENSGFDPARTRTFARLLAVLLVPIHVIGLAYIMVRYQHGITDPAGFSDMNPFTGDWLPAVGPVVPLAMVTAGAAVIVGLVWQAQRPTQPPDPPDPPGGRHVARSDDDTREIAITVQVPRQRIEQRVESFDADPVPNGGSR